ncbi:paramyosin isoform X2 [Culex quinquefasciatus]|uniref:paramyosin isoform X2 n=1 Tax=Culex quinquefasciatus TaxID=7176 RepID=UPI0018E2A891|nr:paramyosin isoform X2 [Culex quinquefasciatus]
MDSGACPAVDHQQPEPVPTMTTSPTDQQEDGGGGDCARCGESRSLDASLMEELNQQYERRLRIVEDHGDDLQFKVQLFSDWIKQLRTMNLDLVEAIQNIQDTCRTRLEQMRDMYRKNEARFGPEAAKRLEGDRSALLEVIRRAYTTGSWDISGIEFFNVSIEELFGSRGDAAKVKVEEPTISVNLAVSSNYPIENAQVEELRQELDAKERQIKNLEQLLEEKFHQTESEFDTDSNIRSADCDSNSKPMLDQLRHMMQEKNQELEQRSLRIDEMSKEIDLLNNSLESLKDSNKLHSQSDTKLLQELQNVSRANSEELDATKRENAELRKQINTLKNQLDSQSIVDNRSLVDEVKNHYDRNRQLERKLRKCEQSLAEANSAVSHRNKVIDQLRQERNCLKKCIPPAALESMALVDSLASESCTSLGSGSSGSSVETVVHSSDLKSKLLELQAVRAGQDNVIAELRGKLNANESELRALHNDYDNNERKLFLIRTEIVRLIRATRENFSKSGITLAYSVRALEEFLSQPLIGVNLSDFTLDEKDQAILTCLQQHLGAIVQVFLQSLENQSEIRAALEDSRQEIMLLQQENRKNQQLIELLKAEDQQQLDEEGDSATTLEDKETSIDSDIMSSVSYEQTITESLAAQRARMQHVLRDMAKEISYLLGKDLSSESLSTFSELDATPLHYLIEDLKREIDAKDTLLQGKTESIVQLEERVTVREKELHRLKLRHDSASQERTSYEKRIEHLQEALREHDRTIEAFRQQNAILGQQLEDMSETLQTYKENLRRTVEEKNNAEDECKNQLVTICNLRSALEETKRNGGASIQQLHDVIQTLQSEVALLSEHLNYAFRENLAKDAELEQYRDANLQLRCQLAELNRDVQELKDIVSLVDVRRELEDQKHRHVALLKDEMKSLQAQMADFQREIASRQRDREYLTYFREKCAELEMEHQLELQRMRDEIESLSGQLAGYGETSVQHEQLLRESNTLQNTIQELQNHNDVLQKAIQSHEESIEQLQQELSTSKFQFGNINQELENLKASCSEKDSKIISLNVEREKLQGDLSLHKRMCKCNFNTNVKERKQVVQKSLEATKAADALKQKTAELKKLETQYVEERIRLTEQTTDLFTQIGKLKGKNSNLEQSLFNKEELIERLQQNLRDLTQRLTAKSEIAQTMETRSVNLSQKLDKIREDSTAREKRLSEELNTIRRSSQDQQNQLQQCENQLAWHREELKELRGKAEAVLKERNSLRQQTSDLTSKLSIAAGKESALCEVLKQLQDELSTKTSRLAEVEDNYRKISHAYQNLRVFNEDLAKQNQAARVHLENYKALVEFKRQTINTVELGRKCAEESRARERLLEQKIAEQKRLIGQLREDRVKLMDKLQDYHKDSLILNQTIEGYQQTYDDSRRNQNTSLHQPFYPSGAFRLVRSSSDPNCKEGDDLLRKLQLTRSRLHRTREFWQQGIKEILAPK